MTNLNLKVTGNVLSLTSTETVATGGANNVRCIFTLPPEWADLMPVAVFYQDNKPKKTVSLANNQCDIPAEVMTIPGNLNIGLYGSNATRTESTTIQTIILREGSYVAGETKPSPDLYIQLSQQFVDTMTACKTSETNAKTSETNAKISESNSKVSETNASTSQAKALTSETNSKTSETNSKLSETNSKSSETKSSQNLADFLAMLGTDVATLVGGKIPVSQIPATAITDIHVITNESQLTSLVAQKGDLAEIVQTDSNGKKTIVKTYQLLTNSPATLNDWAVWGTSYAVQAGNATLADNATNANMINNHRLVEMTQAEYDVAVKDPDTYYLVY